MSLTIRNKLLTRISNYCKDNEKIEIKVLMPSVFKVILKEKKVFLKLFKFWVIVNTVTVLNSNHFNNNAFTIYRTLKLQKGKYVFSRGR
jgi:hypothetical protein